MLAIIASTFIGGSIGAALGLYIFFACGFQEQEEINEQ